MTFDGLQRLYGALMHKWAHRENFKEDRCIPSAAKKLAEEADPAVRRYKAHADIYGGSL